MFIKNGDEQPILKVLSEEEAKKEIKKYQEDKIDTNKKDKEQKS